MRKAVKRSPVAVNPVIKHEAEQRVSLSGEWRFRLDPEDRGIEEKWFDLPWIFQEYIKVPGCWQGQGFGGDDMELHKETLTPIRAFRTSYQGTGWYLKEFTPSADWQGCRIWLNFGGVLPTAEVWVNGIFIGENPYPFVSFGFDVTEFLNFEDVNRVAVRITEKNRNLGFNYNYSGLWSGIYRDVEITVTRSAYIDQFCIYPNERTGEVSVKGAFGDAKDGALLTVRIQAPDGADAGTLRAVVRNNKAEASVALGDVSGWSPDTPALYLAYAELSVDGSISDCIADRFGFVTLSSEGKHFTINGEPYYMRGTGDFGENPQTGSPNTDRDHWRRCLRTLRDYGYNYVRCQSYVPVPEYFDAADEVGLIVQSEMGMLAPIWGHSMENVYNWPRPTPDYREDVRAQWNGVVQRDVNHPSANLYCMSNELHSTYFPKVAWRCYRETKERKPTSLVIWTDGGHKRVFDGSLPEDYVNDDAEADAICHMPLIQHEFKWWSSFPDVRLVEKYKGAAMRNWAAEQAIEATIRHGIPHILPLAAENSQALQFIEMKGKLEALRRDHPTLAGVCHFNALDTMGSPQGVVDIFYGRKYATAEQWRQTNGDAVVLCSLGFHDRILLGGDVFTCRFTVSDFSHPAFRTPTLSWSLESVEGEIFASGEMEFAHIPYRAVDAGEIRVTVPTLDTPRAAVLRAKLSEGKKEIENEWTLWIFPKETRFSEDVFFSQDGELSAEAKTVVTSRFTEELVDFARKGGSVILKASEGLVRPFDPVQHLSVGRYFFSKPASYPPYEELQSGTIIKDHPMFGDLPHEKYADLMFYNMVGESPALDLEPLGLNDADPVIRMIHAYQVSRSLGYLVERRLGKGLVIVTALDLNENLPEASYLLSQMTKYASGGSWEECPQLSQDAIERLISASNLD